MPTCSTTPSAIATLLAICATTIRPGPTSSAPVSTKTAPPIPYCRQPPFGQAPSSISPIGLNITATLNFLKNIPTIQMTANIQDWTMVNSPSYLVEPGIEEQGNGILMALMAHQNAP